MTRSGIRVGGACGFWGDSGIAAPQLIEHGALDYLVFDYLAEITMSIMARARAKNPDAGYAGDFVALIDRHLDALTTRKLKVIANAGGVNPLACARELEAKLAARGSSLKVAVVTGDDLLADCAALRRAGTVDMFDGAPFPAMPLSANAYLGATPIAAALDRGADIVITGRCVDSAVTLGACIHAFGWRANDFDRLAGGSLAGHLIECGAQATGGIHTDWEKTGDWANIGYPIATVAEDGSCLIEKPAGTGGLVSVGTVAEQLVYEIGDPGAYLLPDVVCDFTGVRIVQAGVNRVQVSGAHGRAPTDSYKTSITFEDGHRVGMYLTIGGTDAVAKARKVADAVVRRCETMLPALGLTPYDAISVEVIGAEEGFGGPRDEPREAVLKLAAKHRQPKALELLVRELTSSGTSMAPGICGMGGNRPKVSPVVRLFSCLVPKVAVPVTLWIDGKPQFIPSAGVERVLPPQASPGPLTASEPTDTDASVPLVALAWARSGDKGNNVNIGVIARHPDYLPFIRATLSEAAVAAGFARYLKGRVERFELPGIHGLNFLLHATLDGGGIASLRNDPQGKTFAQVLLTHPIKVPRALAAQLTTSG